MKVNPINIAAFFAGQIDVNKIYKNLLILETEGDQAVLKLKNAQKPKMASLNDHRVCPQQSLSNHCVRYQKKFVKLSQSFDEPFYDTHDL